MAVIKLTALLTVMSTVSATYGLLAARQLHQSTDQISDTWVVEVAGTEDHDQVASRLAEKHGFINLGQVGNLLGYYEFKLSSSKFQDRRQFVNRLITLEERDAFTQALRDESNVGYVEHQTIKKQFKKGYNYPNDPKFKDQWSLINAGQTNGPTMLDLNVEPVWLQGITGSGVVVSVVDDGLEIGHPDLSENYYAPGSWDFVYNDADPTPTNYYGVGEPDNHGTNCAGEIAMAKDNNKCGVGVAYDSHIGCLKIDFSKMTDLVETKALGYKNNHIQVYSNSWGPSDDGFIVKGPGTLVKQTFKNAIQNGRDGKGSIFVWAAGNGGDDFDSCAADGYTSSIYTIGVGSADQTAQEAYYDEQCTGKMVVTYSFNSQTYPRNDTFDPYDQISTTTLDGKCTDDFTGTSASAPLVSGIITLALQANPNLTWRDVQYLLVYTSNPEELVDGEWSLNGGGLNVSHKFGFGAVDAEALVTRARRWITVPPQMDSVFYGNPLSENAYPGQPLIIRFNVLEDDTTITFLEHVVLTASLEVKGYSKSFGLDDWNDLLDSEDYDKWLEDPHPRRGDIMVALTSPQGTTSTLLPFRRYDFINDQGYDNWPFMSVHHWSESPVGQWLLTVSFKSSSGYVATSNLSLVLYGSTTTPPAVQIIPENCSDMCARGCSGPDADSCDMCRELRVISSLECVSTCPNGTFVYKDAYCTDEKVTVHKVEASISVTVKVVIGVAVTTSVTLIVLGLVMIFIFCARKQKKKRGRSASYHIIVHSETEVYSLHDIPYRIVPVNT